MVLCDLEVLVPRPPLSPLASQHARGDITPQSVREYLRKSETKLSAQDLGSDRKQVKAVLWAEHDDKDNETMAEHDHGEDQELETMEAYLADLQEPTDLDESEILDEGEAAEILATMIQAKKKTSYTQAIQRKNPAMFAYTYHACTVGSQHEAFHAFCTHACTLPPCWPAMPIFERGSLVQRLIECQAPKAREFMGVFMHALQVLVATARPLGVLNASSQVLLMLWNTRFDWSVEPFHFVEVFSGDGQCSLAWLLVTMHAHLHSCRQEAGWIQRGLF